MNQEKNNTSTNHQQSFDLKNLLHCVKPIATWDDLANSPKVLAGIKKICRDFTLVKGYNFLFTGNKGTGKTMAAEVIAKELGLALYRIDLSMIVSKYIGETEKNLELLFARAEDKGWILFFDEADALFGKRTNVHDAHDRYANQEVSFLLQRIEKFKGMIILSINMKNAIDKRFHKHFRHIVDFSDE